MLNLQLARKYGMAIFEIAQEENKLDKYGQELAEICSELFTVPELKDFLTNPQIQPQPKKDLMAKLSASRLSPVMFNFVMLLIDKRRIGLLEAINDCYQDLSNKAQGIVIADVTTAYEMRAPQQMKLSDKLKAVTGRKVKMRLHIDKDIIGGIVVKIGDNRIDGSVTGRLQSLKAELMANN